MASPHVSNAPSGIGPATFAGPAKPAVGRPRKSAAADAASARDRILAAAERLFGEHGLSGVGLRAIAADAGVNLAAISYHFGSKEGLLEALFAARAAPIAEARLRLLDECTATADGRPALEDILDAFIRPTLILAVQSPAPDGGLAFRRLRARIAAEPETLARKILAKAFDASSLRFLDAIAAALPELPRADVEWRFHFMLGVSSYTMANSGRIQALTGGRCDPGDIRRAIRHMIPFLAAGFRSAPTPPEPNSSKQTSPEPIRPAKAGTLRRKGNAR